MPSPSLHALAPDFCATTTTAPHAIRLSDYQDKQAVVLYFYPKDHTPGCTLESIAFKQHYPAFLQQGAVIFGISRDSLTSHA